MRQLHRLQLAVDDHGRTQACAEPEEQHTSAFIAAQRLHGSVIDDSDGTAESALKIEPSPSFAEVVRLSQDMVVENDSWIPDRHDVIFPIAGDLTHFINHLFGGHLGTGRKFASRFVTGRQQLNVRSTNIDGKYIHSALPVNRIRRLLRGKASAA